MKDTPLLDSHAQQWAEALERNGLASFAIPLLDVLQVWGFVGAQLLWMIQPLLDDSAIEDLAMLLERPETLRLLQKRLIEGETRE
ncbi:MAG: hypothetical protein JXB35_05260 [Anaerolineae bacterium]|nr:hypothetical protein [Anaerolineae bacterium]